MALCMSIFFFGLSHFWLFLFLLIFVPYAYVSCLNRMNVEKRASDCLISWCCFKLFYWRIGFFWFLSKYFGVVEKLFFFGVASECNDGFGEPPYWCFAGLIELILVALGLVPLRLNFTLLINFQHFLPETASIFHTVPTWRFFQLRKWFFHSISFVFHHGASTLASMVDPLITF